MTYEHFEEVFKNSDDSTQIELWNNLCDDRYYTERLYNMCDLDEIVGGNKKPSEVIEMLDDDFNYKDDYFYFDGYERLCSVNWLDDFFKNGRGDIEEIYSWLSQNEELQEFAEEHDPDYNEEDWVDKEDEDEE